MTTWLKTHAKAIASGIVTLAWYLAGVIPAEGSPADLTWGQWLLSIVALGSAYGITASVANAQPDVLIRLKDGVALAGEAADYQTGRTVDPAASVGDLIPFDAEPEDHLDETPHHEPPSY